MVIYIIYHGISLSKLWYIITLYTQLHKTPTSIINCGHPQWLDRIRVEVRLELYHTY